MPATHDHGYGTGTLNPSPGEWIFSKVHDIGTLESVRPLVVSYAFGNKITYSEKSMSILVRLRYVRAPRIAFVTGARDRCNEVMDNPYPHDAPMARAAWFAGWLRVHEEILRLMK